MQKPTLNMREKYRAIQSSANGTIYFQGGHVFSEGEGYVGLAPEWGPGLFLDEDGAGADAYAKALDFAKSHVPKFDEPDQNTAFNAAAFPVKETPKPKQEYQAVKEDEPLPDIDDVFEVAAEKKNRRTRKGANEPGHGRGSV